MTRQTLSDNQGENNMGFDAFKDEEEQEESSESQSTYVSFKNMGHPEVDVPEEKQHRHKQDYFDAVQEMRDELGQDINTVFGEFAAGAVEADEGDPSRLEELFSNLADSE